MSRSGYSDDCYDQWALIKWRGQVASAIRGKRGQAFLRELLAALESMPEKKLIRGELRKDGEVCTMGAIGCSRGINIEEFDPYEYEEIADAFGIAHQLVQEIEWENDDGVYNSSKETPEERWSRMHAWVSKKIIEAPKKGGKG